MPTTRVRARSCWPSICSATRTGSARAVASPLLDAYLHSPVDAAADWLDGRTSTDYPGYDQMIAKLRASTAADQIASGAVSIGSRAEIAAAIKRAREEFAGFEHASLQGNFNIMPLAEAKGSMRLFAKRVMPRFAGSYA
jgi:hypothetical protein